MHHKLLLTFTSLCFVAEARKKDIPIVQLNPGGTLNHKYAGETAVRGSGLPYSVIRSTGMLLRWQSLNRNVFKEIFTGSVLGFAPWKRPFCLKLHNLYSRTAIAGCTTVNKLLQV